MLRAARDNVYRGAPLAILDTVEQRLLLAEILQTRATDYRKMYYLRKQYRVCTSYRLLEILLYLREYEVLFRIQ